MDPSRRQVLEAGALGALWIGGGCGRRVAATTAETSSPGARADVDVALTARRARVALDASGPETTEVLRFEGQSRAGGSEPISQDRRGYLGPTFRVRSGQRVRVAFENGLQEPSIVHWHGLDVSEENDGHPRFAVESSARREYEFRIDNRPGTYWYHPHPDARTGYQVAAGMAGLFLVTDGDDAARGLPAPQFDLPLVIQDRIIGADGQLVYAPNPMLGFLGDRILVNGHTDASFDVCAGAYRLRLLNGSNARIYKLAWSDGRPMQVIGTDGGFLAVPVARPFVMLAPGERLELWTDFVGPQPSEGVWLESRAFEMGGGMMGGGMMGGGMMGGGTMGGGTMGGSPTGRGMMRGANSGGSALANGAAFRICRFVVKGKGTRLVLPRHLSPVNWRSPDEVANRGQPRRFAVSLSMMRWMLNGERFEMTEVAANERIRLGVTEDWEFSNTSWMMTTAHPIHVHGGHFQIVERQVAPAWRAAAASMDAGLVDDGWKDTFLLRPGERVRIRVRFARHAGLFLYHCHNLEHEDMGMMRNFRVEV